MRADTETEPGLDSRGSSVQASHRQPGPGRPSERPTIHKSPIEERGLEASGLAGRSLPLLAGFGRSASRPPNGLVRVEKKQAACG